MELGKIEHVRAKGWAYNKKLKRYREDVIACQCSTQKSFSKYNATIFFLLGIIYLLLDQFLWKEFQIGTLLYFAVSLLSAVNFLFYERVIPKHTNWVIPAGCFYIFIMGKFLLSLNMIGSGTVSWTLLLCSLISTSMLIIIPAYYIGIMLLTVVLDMVEYLIVNDALVYVFYNLMDDIVICAFCIGINIIFSRLKYEELERKENLLSQSSKDPLTGLFNRRYLERYFEEHSDWHSRCAIIMMDLDNFKMANDTFGHRKGDEVLCRVSDILRKNFRETDCVARLGGDEFAVFIPEVSKTEVIMNRVKQVLQCFPIVIDGETRVEVSVSIGAVLKGNEIAPSYAELCSKADQAMYRAKKTGKAKAVVTNDERQEETII